MGLPAIYWTSKLGTGFFFPQFLHTRNFSHSKALVRIKCSGVAPPQKAKAPHFSNSGYCRCSIQSCAIVETAWTRQRHSSTHREKLLALGRLYPRLCQSRWRLGTCRDTSKSPDHLDNCREPWTYLRIQLLREGRTRPAKLGHNLSTSYICQKHGSTSVSFFKIK